MAANRFAFCPSKALQLDLAQAQFHLGDIEALDPTAETFDAVACVFGIFFLPDTQQASLGESLRQRKSYQINSDSRQNVARKFPLAIILDTRNRLWKPAAHL